MEEGFDYAPPGDEADEATARTEEALAQERDEIDAAASEETWAHQAEQEALGFALAWWDEPETPPLDIAVELANRICGRTQYLHALVKNGYPEGAMASTVILDSFSGPIVGAALQILGTLHSHMRDDVTKVLKTLFDAVPEPTEEDVAEFEEAALAHATAQANALADQFRADGIEALVITDPAEVRDAIERYEQEQQAQHGDSSLN